jgi:hypothetical protein
MNHAHTLLQQARGNEKWFTQILTVDDTNVFDKESLEEEKRNNPQDFFEQEYYCRFIEGAGQFFKNIRQTLIEEEDKPEPNHKYQMGVDLAKYQDYTVLTVIDLNTFHVHKQERFNQIDWVLQKAKIEAMYRRYGNPLIYIDSTGVGDPIYEDLFKQGIRVEGFKFNENSRKDLLNNLAIKIEQNKIKLPETDILQNELNSFHYEISDRGKIRICAPDGLHDDTVMSLALAVWNLPDNPLPMAGSIRYLNRTIQEQHEQTDFT